MYAISRDKMSVRIVLVQKMEDIEIECDTFPNYVIRHTRDRRTHCMYEDSLEAVYEYLASVSDLLVADSEYTDVDIAIPGFPRIVVSGQEFADESVQDAIVQSLETWVNFFRVP